jgi:hypothetical protein
MAEQEFCLGGSRWAPGNNKGNQFGTIRRFGKTNTCFLSYSETAKSIRIAEKLWGGNKLLRRHDEGD